MNLRLLLARIMGVSVLLFALISHRVYADNSVMDVVLEVMGYLLLCTAAMGRIWCSAYISGNKNNKLVMDGPYSIVRNPLYFFSFIGFVGAGIAFESFFIAACFAVVFFVTHWPTILQEEIKLSGLFGGEFQEYKKKVPRFIPMPWLLKNPETVSFSPQIFSRALLQSSLIITIYLVANMVEWAHVNHYLPVVMHIY